MKKRMGITDRGESWAAASLQRLHLLQETCRSPPELTEVLPGLGEWPPKVPPPTGAGCTRRPPLQAPTGITSFLAGQVPNNARLHLSSRGRINSGPGYSLYGVDTAIEKR
ncbi:hypothetical protein CABS01_03282 [Colletotrichum abscissum]|uniref:Uncharacterized protein n=2 Tax=Colletotrichum acutatum species complex TaxID=2707335 RepID=A0A9P9X9L1_9PEZI|nr:uncharacterized protein CLUP02_08716 [Colletotrichum lupini]XP_060392578.1 uncharacterized protein CABS01_03282 [Colletotrichum abscissum]KAI3543031.1 hypothetical protein CABS02_10155 [Colletotrichum abscissum]KAK1477980.1 hypothetical protein CABS01_03282 [Colletotrichum abscissum]UQC83222.1 hypothetical protein CLUP02_08716 [Colletotrichum lupini]